MGTSVQWYSKETDQPTAFPETPWAIQFTAENYQKATGGEWNWETGFLWDQVNEFEKIRDHGLRAVFGNWSFQKNQAPDKQVYANRELDWVAYIGGKRESRRLLGDVILQQQDIVEQREFPDASVTTTWTIDLHYPIQSDHFPGKEFRSRADHVRIAPYPIPYRCFYSRNVENLFMAGRNISVTHVALGTVRVMRTLGMVGEVVGMAAAVCKRHDVDPRQVYTDHLDELKTLMTEGVGKLPLPARRSAAGPARMARSGRAEFGPGGHRVRVGQLRSEAVPGQQHQRRTHQLQRQSSSLGQRHRRARHRGTGLGRAAEDRRGADRDGPGGRQRRTDDAHRQLRAAIPRRDRIPRHRAHQDREQRSDRLARTFPCRRHRSPAAGRDSNSRRPDADLGIRSLRT
jgi:hypothetical protein